MAKGQRAFLLGGGRWKFEAANLREWQGFWRKSVETLAEDNPEGFASAKAVLQSAFQRAAETVRDSARGRLRGVGGPRRLEPATFAFSDFSRSPNRRNQRSSLAGVRTGAKQKDPRLYFQWGKGGIRRKNKPVGSVSAAGFGISLARITESGTRYHRAKRFFKDALFSTKTGVLRTITDAYKQAVVILNRKA